MILTVCASIMQYDSHQDMDRTKSSGAMVWNTSPYVLVETEELVQHSQNFRRDEGIFKVYSVESLVAEFGGTLGPHT